jgi:hypothetical protein
MGGGLFRPNREKNMYPVHGAKGPAGVSIPVGWKIIEIHGNLFYVKEEFTLKYLRDRN